MKRKNLKLVAFDVDGTICESKQDITQEMSSALRSLLKIHSVALISGCNYTQMRTQVVDLMGYTGDIGHLYLLPTSGAQMYWMKQSWTQIYNNDLTLRDKVSIVNAFDFAACCSELVPEDSYGPIAEDRGSQITFSLRGQEAPLDVKRTYDPYQEIRKIIVYHMQSYLGSELFEIRIGGTTSIDVTKKGLDKNYGISRLLDETGYKPEECLFFGDALYEGGNDAPVKETGVECIQVSGPQELLTYLNKLNDE